MRRQGWLHLFETPEAFAAAAYDLSMREARGARLTILKGGEVREFEPGLQRDFHCGVFYSDPAHTTAPFALVSAFADRFVADGGKVELGEVRGLRLENARPILVLHDGSVVRPDKVVIAAGAWSRKLAAMAGSKVPLDTERGYHVMLPHSGIDSSTRSCCLTGSSPSRR